MFKKQLTLYITIIALIVLIIVSYLYSKSNVKPPIYIHDERFENAIIAEGIDVSYYQGESIDWDAIKDDGIDFVMIRCAYRGSESGELEIDKNYKENMDNAIKSDLMVGAYIYSQAITEEEAMEEANFLLALVEDKKITMPLVIDYEIYEDGRLDKAIQNKDLNKNTITDICLAFCKVIENNGYESMVYGNRNFLIKSHDTNRLEKETTIWMANYTNQTNYGGDYSIWQYTSLGLVPGINGNVDKNFWYIDKDDPGQTVDDNKTDINECSIKLDDDSYLYLGRKITPEVILKNNGELLIENEDYYISYINNTSSGEGQIILKGIGNYTGRTILSFNIHSLF